MSAYEQWMGSTGVPIHRGYFVSDLRTLELRPWPERQCNAAFLQLAGQEGVSEARVTEIPPGKTLPNMRFILDEVVYVVEGRGVTTVWPGTHPHGKTFEWNKHSVFMLPRHATFQLTNMDGTRPARLLSYNYAPIVMELAPDESFFFNGPYTANLQDEDPFAVAQAQTIEGGRGGRRNAWQLLPQHGSVGST
jgi:mannose-6-phosphate isomerase-like protein (cupin superfamily)